MESVSPHLSEAGSFVIEAFVPDPGRCSGGQAVRAVAVEVDRVRLDVSRQHPLLQQVATQRVIISENGIRMHPVLIRYAWPAELDALANAAGIKQVQGWADWTRSPFSSVSGRHISVFALR